MRAINVSILAAADRDNFVRCQISRAGHLAGVEACSAAALGVDGEGGDSELISLIRFIRPQTFASPRFWRGDHALNEAGHFWAGRE